MIEKQIIDNIVSIAGTENVYLDEPMSKHTSFKIGGNADVLVTPCDADSISGLVKMLSENNIPFFIMGNGTNLLVSDNGFRGVVIQIYNRFSDYEFVHESKAGAIDKANIVKVRATAGFSLIKLSAVAADYSLTGLEFACGIPGTVGGAVCMNAGAYGGEIKDIIESATVMDTHGNVKVLSCEELELGYRTSRVMKDNLIVIDALFVLRPGDQEQIKGKMNELLASRKEKQPLDYPSAGSTFKRPEGYFAGKLIADAGLKGFSVGGAKVSEKHAGFVINNGNATAADVIELTDAVAKKIFEINGVKLELEIKKLGFSEQ